jgi:hypothetical protein
MLSDAHTAVNSFDKNIVSLSIRRRLIVWPRDLILSIMVFQVEGASDLCFITLPMTVDVIKHTPPRNHLFPPMSSVDIGPQISRAMEWNGEGGTLSLVESLLTLGTFDLAIAQRAQKEMGGNKE